MKVTFEGGPINGQTHTIDPEPTMHDVIYWPSDADPNADQTDIPGHEGVMEYIYEGEGKAAYVAGILDAARDQDIDRPVKGDPSTS